MWLSEHGQILCANRQRYAQRWQGKFMPGLDHKRRIPAKYGMQNGRAAGFKRLNLRPGIGGEVPPTKSGLGYFTAFPGPSLKQAMRRGDGKLLSFRSMPLFIVLGIFQSGAWSSLAVSR